MHADHRFELIESFKRVEGAPLTPIFVLEVPFDVRVEPLNLFKPVKDHGAIVERTTWDVGFAIHEDFRRSVLRESAHRFFELDDRSGLVTCAVASKYRCR
jgi:hypothetical protein